MSEQIQTEQAEKPNEEDVISAIYNEIESKKNFVAQLKDNYYSPSGDIISIKVPIFNDILDEFEITIKYSLQAIQTLQTEIWNLKEKILQEEEYKANEPNVQIPQENEIDINNNNEMTNRNMNQSNINKTQSDDPSRLYYDYSQISGFNYYMLSDKNFQQKIREKEEEKMQLLNQNDFNCQNELNYEQRPENNQNNIGNIPQQINPQINQILEENKNYQETDNSEAKNNQNINQILPGFQNNQIVSNYENIEYISNVKNIPGFQNSQIVSNFENFQFIPSKKTPVDLFNKNKINQIKESIQELPKNQLNNNSKNKTKINRNEMNCSHSQKSIPIQRNLINNSHSQQNLNNKFSFNNSKLITNSTQKSALTSLANSKLNSFIKKPEEKLIPSTDQNLIQKSNQNPVQNKNNNKEEEEKHIKAIKENLLPKNSTNSIFTNTKTYNPYSYNNKIETIKKSVSAENIAKGRNLLKPKENNSNIYIQNDYEGSMKNNASEMPQNYEEISSNHEKTEEQQQLINELSNQASVNVSTKIPIRQSIRQVIQSTKIEKQQKKEETLKKTKEDARHNIQNQKLKFLLEKISKVETYRTYFGDKYGEGNYQIFLDKLKNNQINMDNLEDELLIIADLMANQINSGIQQNNEQNYLPEEPDEMIPVPIPITKTGPLGNNIPNPVQNLEYYTNPEFRTGNIKADPERLNNLYTQYIENKMTINPRPKSKSKEKNIRVEINPTSNPYVEPVKFDAFLRQNDRSVETKKRMNFSLAKK